MRECPKGYKRKGKGDLEADSILPFPLIFFHRATTGTGGKSLKLKWNDNNQTPKLSSDWGGINIFLAAGGEATQYKLQQLASNINVSKTHGSYIVDASIGPNGQYYFIRMEGTKTNSSGIPPMAFSARFTLSGMTGNFNSSVLAAAQGKEGSAPGSSSGASSTSSTGLTRSTSVASSSAARPTSSSQSVNATSSAGKHQQALLLVAGAAVAAAGFVVLM